MTPKPPAIPRPPACNDCAHCTRTPRGKGNHSYACALHGDCYAARTVGGACGVAAKDWVAKAVR